MGAILQGCGTNPDRFDESAWLSTINTINANDIYSSCKRGNTYFNPWLPMPERGFLAALSWRVFGERKKYSTEEEAFLPGVIQDAETLIRVAGQDDFIMWIGHGTFLLRIDGEYWLIDPIFSKRALILSRYLPVAISAEGIGRLTDRINIIITHNHYDHCDEDSIRALPHAGRTFVPAGLGKLLGEWGRIDVTEMTWWQGIDLARGAHLLCIPAQHWSRRITQGLNTTLWAGFILFTPRGNFFFAGDTGYFPLFREIAGKYPRIDFALLPVSASHPRWMMHYAHMDVEEAVKAFTDLNARYFIPSHWGTFRLGDEPPGYAGTCLKKIAGDDKNFASKLVMPSAGEIIHPGRM